MTDVQLPRDDAFLEDELLQWWYWTGHLSTDSGRQYGFELCFFALDADAMHLFELLVHALDRPAGDMLTGQMMNAALTDIGGNRFHSRVDYAPGPPEQRADGFHLSNPFGDCQATGGGGKDRLRSTVGDFQLALDLTEAAPPTLHYGGRRHPYGFGGYTYYYSREKMTGSGTLTLQGRPENVTASVWFDRQYGDLLQAALLVGWQWFAIQLEDNTQLMLFAYHNQPEHMGSITDAGGVTRPLGADDFKVTVTDWWASPHSQRRFPAGWLLEIAGQYRLQVSPLVADQELAEAWLIPKYWEGACRVQGSHCGSAYVELVGYRRRGWL